MALIDPPIDKLIDKANGKYGLCVVISKRAKELLVQRPDFFRENQKVKPISFACEELYKDKIFIHSK